MGMPIPSDSEEIVVTVQGYFYQISKGGGTFEILDLF